MDITTGKENYKVIGTGTVITFEGEAISFQLAPDLKVSMSFENDKEIKDQKMDFKSVNNKELEIIITNFNNPIGTGNAEPLPVARIDNRQVYLNFIVYALSENSSKNIHYTWYSREEVKND